MVEVDPLLTDHPATKVEETVTAVEEEEDLTVDDQTVTTIVEVEEEEVTPETNDTLRAEEENDLTVPLLTETDTVRAEEEEVIATVQAVEKTTVLRGTTVIVITDANPGGGIRGHPTLLEQGRGVPLEGKGLLLATRSRKITSFLKFQLRRRT